MLFENLKSNLPFEEALLRERFQNPAFLIGYGSGVFSQSGYTASDRPQVDFIVGVENLREWHRTNRRNHPEDYKGVFAQRGPVHLANSFYPGYLGFPYVEFEGHAIKYGIVDKTILERDLCIWKSFYFAGRLQKPVHGIIVNERTEGLMKQNLSFALSVALDLTELEELSAQDLFEEISALSYRGDIRGFTGFEDPQKVKNLVSGNLDNFHSYYEEIVSFFGINPQTTIRPQEVPQRVYPSVLRDKVRTMTPEEKRRTLNTFLRKKILNSSIGGSAKGLINPGLLGARRYLKEKRRKAQRAA